MTKNIETKTVGLLGINPEPHLHSSNTVIHPRCLGVQLLCKRITELIISKLSVLAGVKCTDEDIRTHQNILLKSEKALRKKCSKASAGGKKPSTCP